MRAAAAVFNPSCSSSSSAAPAAAMATTATTGPRSSSRSAGLSRVSLPLPRGAAVVARQQVRCREQLDGEEGRVWAGTSKF